jgi:hypothetical protein
MGKYTILGAVVLVIVLFLAMESYLSRERHAEMLKRFRRFNVDPPSEEAILPPSLPLAKLSTTARTTTTKTTTGTTSSSVSPSSLSPSPPSSGCRSLPDVNLVLDLGMTVHPCLVKSNAAACEILKRNNPQWSQFLDCSQSVKFVSPVAMLFESALQVFRQREHVEACADSRNCFGCYEWIRRRVLVDLRLDEKEALTILEPCKNEDSAVLHNSSVTALRPLWFRYKAVSSESPSINISTSMTTNFGVPCKPTRYCSPLEKAIAMIPSRIDQQSCEQGPDGNINATTFEDGGNPYGVGSTLQNTGNYIFISMMSGRSVLNFPHHFNTPECLEKYDGNCFGRSKKRKEKKKKNLLTRPGNR